MRFRPEPKLSAEPVVKAFDKLTKEEVNTIVLFGLAYSNRMLYKSATHIKRDLQLTYAINTMHVRYLLLLYFCSINRTAKQGSVSFKVLEKSDYFRIEKKRLVSAMQLAHQGLAEYTPTKAGNNAFTITDKGKKAISIVFSIIHETIHCYPKTDLVSTPKRIDTIYNLD